MSLAKKKEPDVLVPVVNPVAIIYDSSFAEQSGFRYKIDLINSGSTDELSVWVYPDTDNDYYGIYNFNMLLGDLIGADKNWDTTEIKKADNSLYSWNYRLTEYIGSTSGVTVTGTTSHYVFRGLVQYGTTWDSGDYTPRTGTTASFLSQRNKREYTLSETAVVNTLTGTFDYDTNWNAVVILVNGTSKYYYDIITGTTNNILTLPIGPQQLNTMATAGNIKGYSTGSGTTENILTSSSSYYEIWLENYTGKVASETIRIDLDHGCYKHDGVEFLWLGELSTYESYTFRAADIKAFNTKRNEIKSDYWGVNSDDYTYNIGDRGRKNVNVTSTESHKVLSGWIKDDEATDLMELFSSPDVYIKKSGNIYPIIITNTSYVEKTIKNDLFFNYTIDFEMAYEKISNI